MRPRIRTVKPEVFQDERLWDLSVSTGLPLLQGFIGLWCFSDREGRFEWRPRALKNGILPYWDGDFARVLDALERARFILRYTVDSQIFGVVRTFLEHQVINQREAQSVLPAPPQETHVRAHGEGNGTEGNGTEGSVSSARPPVSILDVPGLRIVHPGPLQPSRREQELTAKAEALTANDQPRHEFTPGWSPGRSNQVRGHELGLTDEEIWARWETAKDAYFTRPFRSDVKQFNRELAFAAQDKQAHKFKSQRERDAFEMPGRERRA